MSEHVSEADPCVERTSARTFAFVWFLSILVISGVLAFKLCRADRWMYDNNGEFLDNAQARANRLALTSLPSETVDIRQHPEGTLPHPTSSDHSLIH